MLSPLGYTNDVPVCPRPDGSVSVIDPVTTHPFASVTVRLYVPAVKVVRSSDVDVNPPGPVHANV